MSAFIDTKAGSIFLPFAKGPIYFLKENKLKMKNGFLGA
jgi:hypothetical protein